MPLSEQEQRLLDEMERSLYHNEADDVTTVGADAGVRTTQRSCWACSPAIAGIALLIVGVVVRQPLVGVLRLRHHVRRRRVRDRPAATPRPSPRAAARSRPPTGFMDSLNERWERRQDDSRALDLLPSPLIGADLRVGPFFVLRASWREPGSPSRH